MDNYKEMYYRLFNKMSELIEEIKAVQQETEDMFLSHREKEKIFYLQKDFFNSEFDMSRIIKSLLIYLAKI